MNLAQQLKKPVEDFQDQHLRDFLFLLEELLEQGRNGCPANFFTDNEQASSARSSADALVKQQGGMNGQAAAPGLKAIQLGQHFAFDFNLKGLAHNRAAGDVLYRALHHCCQIAQFRFYPQHLAGVAFADHFH